MGRILPGYFIEGMAADKEMVYLDIEGIISKCIVMINGIAFLT